MKKSIISAQTTFKIPHTPNFLMGEDKFSRPIEKFTDEELKEVGRMWTDALLENARVKRKKL